MPLKKSFLDICLAFSVYLTVILGLAIFGYFYFLPVITATSLLILLSLYFVIRSFQRWKWKRISKYGLASIIIIFLFSLIIGIFHHDLPTSRDDLSYIYGADRLVDSHSLKWEDYFSRPVHGVRNLEDNLFTSQFLPIYIAYLAVYYLFGGLSLLFWANVLLMVFTLGTIYYLVKNLAGEKGSLLALIFLLSSYVFFWFPKRTNVENIFIFLIWFGLWMLTEAINKKRPLYLFYELIPFSLLSLTRAEGLIFFAFYLIISVLLIIFKFRKELKDKVYLFLLPILAMAVNFILFYYYIKFYKANYIITQAIDVLESFNLNNLYALTIIISIFSSFVVICLYIRKKINYQKLLFWIILGTVALFELYIFLLVKSDSLTWVFYRTQYVLENFVFYFYFIYIFIILFGLRKKIFTNQEFTLTIVLLPAFLFIIEPNIALDQPWFMRRFYPTLIPLFIILSAVVLARLELKRKKLVYLVTFLILIGLIFNGPIIFAVEHKRIRSQLEEFNSKFPRDSLILMNPGWSWQKIAILQHYFYGYNALPNFDLYRSEEFKNDLPGLVNQYPSWENDDNDLINIINWKNDQSERRLIDLLNNYNQVYVVTDRKNSNLFDGFSDDNLEKVDNFNFSYQELQKESNITGYIKSNSKIELNRIRKLQNNIPPNRIIEQDLSLDIYKVIEPLNYNPIQYVLDANQKQDGDYIYRVLSESDLKGDRDEIKSLIGDIEIVSGE
ncbi:MAG: hypothetical protein COT24_01150 [Candidatus Kerfeldbacteria bacterium CG08_land_8_20_14_0_20_40_16]|uniref:Glycosyltransferase RgtA/B/C/D-like domain-containing protein n=1 Tax=Candidatus Kerfeldbacteria bacterium CG08_land_8_20_14_0_20_40_16 TaxID=2014244 RepID=A0A2H0YWJ2_9BACT|nr:MAG: hypothetical protein COT24_01150 [Candidatus Kerfeldbacteria bacterium CG08_land_8_20_14_0_20_40_16]